MDIETNDRTVIRYKYRTPCSCKPHTKFNNVNIMSMTPFDFGFIAFR